MISAKGLIKRFGQTVALDGLSLEVEGGSVFGLIGPNGAGKTTALSILATLQPPDGGAALVGGRDVAGDTAGVRGLMGYMPDFFGVYDGLTVYEYLDFFAGAYRLPGAGRGRLIGELLELVNLGGKKDSYVDLLSRGMKQRLALARCLVHDPGVLILDEPASGLDPGARAEMKEIVRQLGRMGKTVLISSHILPELAEICHRVAIMENGRVTVSGTVDEVTAASSGARLIFIEILEDAGGLAGILGQRRGVCLAGSGGRWIKLFFSGSKEEQGMLLRDIMAGGYTVTQFHEVRRNLEEAYMAVTGEGDGRVQ